MEGIADHKNPQDLAARDGAGLLALARGMWPHWQALPKAKKQLPKYHLQWELVFDRYGVCCARAMMNAMRATKMWMSHTVGQWRTHSKRGCKTTKIVLRKLCVLMGTTLRTPLISGVHNSSTHCFHVLGVHVFVHLWRAFFGRGGAQAGGGRAWIPRTPYNTKLMLALYLERVAPALI